jgi:glycine/D-amino acid oxidase-like deaminating enzyme
MTTDLRPTPTFVNGAVSWWHRSLGYPERRPTLPGDVEADVAIVGAGFTGLWTAYYLTRHQPSLRVVVLEKEYAGFGASGRNGGWLMGAPPGDIARYAASHGHDEGVRLQRTMFASVDEVITVAAREGIEADIVKAGLLRVATDTAQQRRLEAETAAFRFYGWGPEDLVELSGPEIRKRIALSAVVAGTWSPHCARVQPARLARGLAEAVERQGATIYEDTAAVGIAPGTVHTTHGMVRARFVVRALEGYTAGLPGYRRQWLPLNSNMIVTEPLPHEVWDEIGWRDPVLLGDEAHVYVYAQRTADGRIAIGGRGVPYRYGSRWDEAGTTYGRAIEELRATLLRLLPATRAVGVEHAWSGILGVPRDWCGTVGLDRSTGIAWAGGYVGHGVTATNLAGRTLADLMLERDSDLVTLPWVGRGVRRWEPEPARWLGVRGLYRAYHLADRWEKAGHVRAADTVAKVADVVSRR